MTIKEAEILALSLMEEHLCDSKNDWGFKFSNAKKVFGVCLYSKEDAKEKIHIIKLSKPLSLLNGEDKVKDTILHEIAHALDVDDRGFTNHDWRWTKIAKSIGSNGMRCYDETVEQPPAKYTAECSTCEKIHERHRKPKKGNACGACCTKHNKGKYSTDYILNYFQNF